MQDVTRKKDGGMENGYKSLCHENPKECNQGSERKGFDTSGFFFEKYKSFVKSNSLKS